MLIAYNVISVHMGKTDVTEVCKIKDGVMNLRCLDEADIKILHG